MLKETARRGLIYVDDGSSPRSLAGQIAGANNLPFAKAEVELDAVPTPAHIDRALARLEALAQRARQRGRHRLGAAGLDRADRAMGQGRRRPRHRAGADHRGRDQAEVELSDSASRIRQIGSNEDVDAPGYDPGYRDSLFDSPGMTGQ